MIIRNWNDEDIINSMDMAKELMLRQLLRDEKISEETVEYYKKHYHVIMIPPNLYSRIFKLFGWSHSAVTFQLIKIEE